MSTIRFQLTEQEVVRALVKHRKQPRRIFWARLALLVCGLILLGTFSFVPPGDPPNFLFTLGGIFVLLPIIFWFLSPWLLRRAYAKVVRSNPVFTDPKEVTFDDKGITFVSPHRRSELAWAGFVQVSEDEQYFYLHGDKLGNVAPLPKQAFDAASTDEFLRCTRHPETL